MMKAEEGSMLTVLKARMGASLGLRSAARRTETMWAEPFIL